MTVKTEPRLSDVAMGTYFTWTCQCGHVNHAMSEVCFGCHVEQAPEELALFYTAIGEGDEAEAARAEIMRRLRGDAGT